MLLYEYGKNDGTMTLLLRELSRTLSYRQRYVLALVRTFSGSLSLFSSSIIIYKIYLRYKGRPDAQGNLRSKPVSNTYYRMLFGVSLLDVMYSFWAALSVLPVPKETGGVFAYGNVATCSTQAFFVNASGSILLYMATLNTYFMLKIRYNISDAIIEKRYEIWLHALPIVVWLTAGIVGLSLKVFGPIILPELGCWIGSYPSDCWETNTCTRGFRVYQNNDLYAWTFAFMWLFLCVIVVTMNSILIYNAIRKQERRNEKYLAAVMQKQGSSSPTRPRLYHSGNSAASQLSLPDFDLGDVRSGDIAEDPVLVAQPMQSSHTTCLHDSATTRISFDDNPMTLQVLTQESMQRPLGDSAVNEENSPASAGPVPNSTAHTHQRRLQQSRMAAVQSSCYIVSALFLAVWTFLPWVGHKLQVDAPVRFFFAFMTNAVGPAQGFLNLLIFVRLQYLHLRASDKNNWGRFRCFRHCLFSSA